MFRNLKLNNIPELNLLCIKDFCHVVNSQERILINNSIELDYLNSLAKGYMGEYGYNFPLVIDETSFFSTLYEEYKALCYELFGRFHITSKNKPTCWCYRSNKNDFKSGWHNHLATSTINGVYYYQVEGDGINFERHGQTFYYEPQQGELLIFPNDLNHKPEKATSENWRYSINMEILTEESSSTLFKKYGLS